MVSTKDQLLTFSFNLDFDPGMGNHFVVTRMYTNKKFDGYGGIARETGNFRVGLEAYVLNSEENGIYEYYLFSEIAVTFAYTSSVDLANLKTSCPSYISE